MTEMQSTRHDAPLKPGEIRQHNVGPLHFVVQHTGGGSFTQARTIGKDGTTMVLKTSMHEHEAVRAYADAIAAAEARHAELLGTGPLPNGGLTNNLPLGADMALVNGEPQSTGDIPVKAGHTYRIESASAYREREAAVSKEATSPSSLRELLDAYGEHVAKAAMQISFGRMTKAVRHAANADVFKAEILRRFGGEQ